MIIINRKTKDPIYAERHFKKRGTITLKAQTRDGLVTRYREFPMDSMTQNYWKIMAMQMGSRPTSESVTVNGIQRLSGAGDDVSDGRNSGSRYIVKCGVGELWGLRVGTGDTPVKVNDLTLDEIISHGTSAGQLNHLETHCNFSSTSTTASRAFENLSGGTINVSEVGVCVRRMGVSATSTNPYLFARDLLPEPFELLNGNILTITCVLSASEGTLNMHRAWMPFALGESVADWRAPHYNTGGTVVELQAFGRETEALAGNDIRNIILGTGDKPVEREDIDLDERLSQGDGSGQLLYGAGEGEDWVITDTEISWETKRTILNDSGEDYLIAEMGLFSSMVLFSTTYSGLLDRFLLPVPIEIKHGENREVRWRFSYSL